MYVYMTGGCLLLLLGPVGDHVRGGAGRAQGQRHRPGEQLGQVL
jgi:hypothetical protein